MAFRTEIIGRDIRRRLGIIIITLTKVSYTLRAKILKDIKTPGGREKGGGGRRVIDLLDDGIGGNRCVSSLRWRIG